MSLILSLLRDDLLGTYFLHFPCWEGDKKKCVSKNYDSEFEIEWNPFVMVSFTTCALGNRTKLLYKFFCLLLNACPMVYLNVDENGLCYIWGFLQLLNKASLVAKTVKNLPAMQETRVQSLGQEEPLEKAIHSSILAWRIPGTEESGRLQSIESQREGQDWTTNTSTFWWWK